MKKIICAILSMMMFFSLAFAEVDLKSMGTADLQALYTKVVMELLSRTDTSVELTQGIWVVGRDIPSGRYNLKADNVIVSVYKSEDSAIDEVYSEMRSYYTLSSLIGSNEVANLTLREGEAVSIEIGNVKFTRLN